MAKLKLIYKKLGLPPTWEEFKEMDDFSFIAKDGSRIIVVNDSDYDTIYILDIDFCLETFDYNKENYIKACEYARSLFLGDEK